MGIKREVQWAGAGWYGERQEKDRVGVYRVPTDAAQNEYQVASDDGYRAGLGSVEWMSAPE